MKKPSRGRGGGSKSQGCRDRMAGTVKEHPTGLRPDERPSPRGAAHVGGKVISSLPENAGSFPLASQAELQVDQQLSVEIEL